ncbi:MAG: YybH family protein [Isosphaeraceae bacterium]
MRIRFSCLIAIGSLFSTGLWAAGEPQVNDAPLSEHSSREPDREAIFQSARDFTAAFEKGDAKAVAALWTEQGEYESDDGPILRGRTAIEAAFAARFKDRPAGKMEIKVESIRFPSRDTAVEEGLTRTTASDMLPDSAHYRTLHVREDGKWRIALSREWGAAENRIADLDWLIGSWRGQVKDHEMVISFSREKDGPFIVGEFAATAAGKTESLGTMKIGIDPVSGQFMSWHFDQDGGHGRGLWLREGNNWVVDSRGNQADGAETASVNILTRFGGDELGWRSIDRMVGGQAQPDSLPVRLKRVAVAK